MRFLLLLALCAELAVPQTTARPAAPPDLDGWVARAMQAFEVPGLALAIVSSLNPDRSIDQARMRAVSRETDFSYDFQDLLLRPIR